MMQTGSVSGPKQFLNLSFCFQKVPKQSLSLYTRTNLVRRAKYKNSIHKAILKYKMKGDFLELFNLSEKSEQAK